MSLKSREEKGTFNESQIDISDFSNYLDERSKQEPGFEATSALFKQRTLSLVEEASRKLIFAHKRRFRKDPRAYQLYALDFVVDSSLKPWLIDIKHAPVMTLKQTDLITSILEHQFLLTNLRKKKVIQYLETVKSDIDVKIIRENWSISSYASLLSHIKNVHNFLTIQFEVKAAMRDYPDNIQDPDSMVLMYDERIRYGKKVTAGVEKERFVNKIDVLELIDEPELDL